MYKWKLYKILGICIIGWFIYRFAILKKLPYLINENIPSWTIIIVMIVCVTQIVILISLVRLLKKRESTSLNKIIIVVMEKIYYTPLREVGAMMMEYSFMKKSLYKSAQIVELLIRRKEAIYLVIFMLYFMPKWQLAISLICDVFILNKIYLFYKWLWIVLLVLGYQGFFGLLKLYIMSEKKELEENFIILQKVHLEKTQLLLKVHLEKPQLQNITNKWLFYTNVLDIITALSVCQQNKYFVIGSILLTSLFIISWSTYLIKVFYLLIPQDPTNFITWLVRIIIGI